MSCDLIKLATPGVSGLQPYHPGKPMDELERELGLTDIIKLASNENPLGAGDRVMQALQQPREISRYPDGNGHKLKSALAEFHHVNFDQITLGNGSNDVLELIARATVSPAHEVIFSEHAFAVYPLVVQALGAKSVVTPARDWGHDTEAMVAAITDKTRLMFIANPNNPTGTWLQRNKIEALLQMVPDNVIVVIDEAYFEYVQEPQYPNCIELLQDYQNLLVTRTFSKAYGLAGLRIGYAVSHPDLADLMNRVRQPFNVNSIAMAAAEIALSDYEHIERSIKLNQSGLQQLISAFNNLGLDYIPSVANFICVDLQETGIEIYNKLLRKGVIVRPIDVYGMPNHLRVTIGLEQENRKFIKALTEVLAE